jgi:hypothetical protein
MLLFTSHCDGGSRDYVLRFWMVNFAVCSGGWEAMPPSATCCEVPAKKTPPATVLGVVLLDQEKYISLLR